MTSNNNSKVISDYDYKGYVEKYTPFQWDNNDNDPRPDIKNKHNL